MRGNDKWAERFASIPVDATDLMLGMGLVAIPVGVGLWSVPAGVISAGLECVGLWGFSLAVRMRG